MKTSILLLVSCFLLISCTTDEASSENARLQISLVDSPAEYDQINIDVQEINVKFGVAEEAEEDEEEESWTNISDFDPQVINILDLVNGEEEVLVDREIPSGTLGEVRLVLGNNNTLVMDDESLDLKVPSGSQSGLKIKINEDLLAGVSYKLILDFDAAKSVVKAGNSGKFNLKPVIHASMEAQTGAISGAIDPISESVVYAIQGTDSVSTYTDDDGLFLIRALAAGNYNLAAISETDTATLSDVEVLVGEVTLADTLKFE